MISIIVGLSSDTIETCIPCPFLSRKDHRVNSNKTWPDTHTVHAQWQSMNQYTVHAQLYTKVLSSWWIFGGELEIWPKLLSDSDRQTSVDILLFTLESEAKLPLLESGVLLELGESCIYCSLERCRSLLEQQQQSSDRHLLKSLSRRIIMGSSAVAKKNISAPINWTINGTLHHSSKLIVLRTTNIYDGRAVTKTVTKIRKNVMKARVSKELRSSWGKGVLTIGPLATWAENTPNITAVGRSFLARCHIHM